MVSFLVHYLVLLLCFYSTLSYKNKPLHKLPLSSLFAGIWFSKIKIATLIHFNMRKNRLKERRVEILKVAKQKKRKERKTRANNSTLLLKALWW